VIFIIPEQHGQSHKLQQKEADERKITADKEENITQLRKFEV
jgi:hypothetical protein